MESLSGIRLISILFVVLLVEQGIRLENCGSIVPVFAAGSKQSHEVEFAEGQDPDSVCANCHREIYERYRATPMANASGNAGRGFLAANFTHNASGVSYRISKEAGKVILSFEREPTPDGEGLRGKRELRYFVGSGVRGRTYLFEDRGYWFEAPINWYAKKKIWDMAPNYLNAREMPLTLAVDPGCLRCHATGAQPSLPEARNKYAGNPFLKEGIGCLACHGDASAHLASGGKSAMARLEELPSVERDSVCLSCHLEGQAAVVKQGKQLVDFKPGESIFDYASFFVHRDEAGSGGRATSQWEALLQSACKRGAGDKLTCITCHDPHGSDTGLSASQKIQYYRGKCLQCHESDSQSAASEKDSRLGGFAERHHPENPDCVSCHMQKANSIDIAHEQVTDHRIISHLPGKVIASATTGPLVAVGPRLPLENASERDLGLAYAQMAARGDKGAASEAMRLLTEAEKNPDAARDFEMHAQLGFLEQVAGQNDQSKAEYEEALAADPFDNFAAGNLAFIEAGSHRYSEAVRLWDKVISNDPAQIKAGMNLAIVECGLGHREAALAALNRVLEFSPDDSQVSGMERAIRSGHEKCGKH